jgi:hypothetical protein
VYPQDGLDDITRGARGRNLRDRPFGDLISEVAGQTSTLVRREIRLAQAELTEKGRHAGRGGGMLWGAAAVAVLAAGALTAAIVAGALARAGRERLKPATQRIPDTPEEGVECVETRTGSAAR